jgi:protocatechuate 3,4-dioxygenase beta subunit
MSNQITRRQALGAAGSAGAALLTFRSGLGLKALEQLVTASPADAAASAGRVSVTPSMTEGPYWVDEMLRRFDVRGNTASASRDAGVVQPGVPLTLRIDLLDASNGGAINGAHVDIWHANAEGLYSDEAGQQTGGGTTNANTAGQNFLRGYQVSGLDAGIGPTPVDGQVSFKTIWPGWYSGRAIHIHVRVRTYDSSGTEVTNYTTQIFFSDTDNTVVLTGAAPYNTRTPESDPTTDGNDSVLTSSAVATNVVPVAGSLADGFAARFTIGLSGVRSRVSGAAKADTTVAASLKSAGVITAANGNRTAVLDVHAGEIVTARAKVTRDGAVLGAATGQLTPGWHALRLALPTAVAAGAATATVLLADAAGNTRTLQATVQIPG